MSALEEHATELEDTNVLKRRQDEQDDEGIEESNTKRQKLETGKASPSIDKQPTSTVQAHSTSPPPVDSSIPREDIPIQSQEQVSTTRRRSGAVDEKQRNKRLFGAVLGNLSRPSDRASKRRTDIEQRKKAELQQQDDERIEGRQRRLARLAASRKRRQIDVDEDNMIARHKAMLKTAHFLQTDAEPRVYYRPYELLRDQEDRIDNQIDDTRDQIDKEIEDFEEERKRRIEALDEAVPTIIETVIITDQSSSDPVHEKDRPVDSPSTMRGDGDNGDDHDDEVAGDGSEHGDAEMIEGDEAATKETEGRSSPHETADSVLRAHDGDGHSDGGGAMDEDDDHADDGDEDRAIY